MTYHVLRQIFFIKEVPATRLTKVNLTNKVALSVVSYQVDLPDSGGQHARGLPIRHAFLYKNRSREYDMSI